MSHFTEDSFENALALFLESTLIDLRETGFIDPYGMVGLLEIGEDLISQAHR